jgi:hypothetical protein
VTAAEVCRSLDVPGYTHSSRIIEKVVPRSWLDHWFVQPAPEFREYLRSSCYSVGKNHLELAPASLLSFHTGPVTLTETLQKLPTPGYVSS